MPPPPTVPTLRINDVGKVQWSQWATSKSPIRSVLSDDVHNLTSRSHIDSPSNDIRQNPIR